MNRYRALLKLNLCSSYFTCISIVLLMIYLVGRVDPNYYPRATILLYITLQITVLYGVLLPLLMRWRYSPTLHLMPGYNRLIKKATVGLFTLFIVIPALSAWVRGEEIGSLLTFTVVIWNIYIFLIFRRYILNKPFSLQSDYIFICSIGAWIAVLVLGNLFGWFTFLGSIESHSDVINFWESIYFQVGAVILSFLIWLLPTRAIREVPKSSIRALPNKTVRKKLPNNRFSIDALFFVPAQTKLVFGILSGDSFAKMLGIIVMSVLVVISVNYYWGNDKQVYYYFLMSGVLGYPALLKSKEKLTTLLFWLNGRTEQVEKIIYRAFFSAGLYFSAISMLCLYIASYVLAIDIPVYRLLLFGLFMLSSLYIQLRLSAFFSWLILMVILLIGAYLSEQYIELLYVVLLAFITWSYTHPPTNWLKTKYMQTSEGSTPSEQSV